MTTALPAEVRAHDCSHAPQPCLPSEITTSLGGSGRVLVAQIGARRHYAVPRALHAVGMLDRLVTDITAHAGISRIVASVVPEGLRPPALRKLIGRRVEALPTDMIEHLPSFALSPWHRRRGGEAMTDFWARRNASFCRKVEARGLGGASTVYAFNGAALEIFEAARRRGIGTMLDQTAAAWRWNRIMLRSEAERWAGWEGEEDEIDLSGRLSEREEAEWRLADRIVCGSSFARDTLVELGADATRCSVVPYAGHVARSRVGGLPDGSRRGAHDRPLRVLFVGTLQLRKGLPYLLAAVDLLPRSAFEIRLVGPPKLAPHAMHLLAQRTEVIGAVPRGEVDRHYDWADVMVLPTLSEGSANVCYEAMAAGLAVVTTPNAGSVITDGVDGLLVPARDAEALAAALARLEADRALLAAIAAEARVVSGHASLLDYAASLRALVPSCVRSRTPDDRLT